MKFFNLKFLCVTGLPILLIGMSIPSCATNNIQRSYNIDFNADQYTLDIASQKTNFVLKATLTDNNGYVLPNFVRWNVPSDLANTVDYEINGNIVTFTSKSDISTTAKTYTVVANFNNAMSKHFKLFVSSYTAPTYGATIALSTPNAHLNQNNTTVTITANVISGIANIINWTYDDNGIKQTHITYPVNSTGNSVSFTLTPNIDTDEQSIIVKATMADAAPKQLILNIDKYVKPEVWDSQWIPKEKLIIDGTTLKGVTNDFNNANSNNQGKQNAYTTLHIPREVTAIANYAFCEATSGGYVTTPTIATNIVNLDFGEAPVRDIGKWAFTGCHFTNKLVLPSQCVNLGESTFMECSFQELDFSQATKLTVIAPSSFARCGDVTKITWNNTLTQIRNDAFYGLRNFNSTSLNLPNSLKIINDQAFIDLGALNSSLTILFNWPPQLTSIGVGVFMNSRIVTDASTNKIEVPSFITSVPASLFNANKSVQTIDLHSNITRVGDSAFYKCSNLEKVYLRSSTLVKYSTTTPAYLYGWLVSCPNFESTYDATHNGQIFVPSTLLQSYKDSSEWSTIDDSHFFSL